MAKKSGPKITLIESTEKSPSIKVSAGQKIEVVSVSIRRPGPKQKGAQLATLCGSDDTCVAIIEVD